MKKKIIWAILFVLVVMQFFRPGKNISTENGKEDIASVYVVSQQVDQILHKACYDCHSNNTVYPWYSNIQPVGWVLNHHIVEGKEELNFSEFGNYNKTKQLKKLKEIRDEVREGEMPITSYTWMHPSAKLTSDEIEVLDNWVTDVTNKISQAL